ncbi:MAG: L-lactate MFS transporter [Sarcina sp.]
MNTSKNRSIILIGTILAQIGLGSLYTWSLFNTPLAKLNGFTLEQVVLSFSITSFSLAIGTLFAGKLQDLLGIKVITCLCGIILGLGLIIAPRFTSLTALYLSAGVIVGLADGIAYILTLSNCIKWFPEKKGLISGISIGSYGLGSLIFKYINSAFLEYNGVVLAFMYWGILAFILVFIGGIFLKDAPLAGKIVNSDDSINNQPIIQKQYKRLDLFSSPQAYLLFIAFFASCLSGLYIIGTAKNIGVIFAGLSPVDAGNSVALIAIFNTIGRLILGSASDRITRAKVSAFAFLLIFLSVLLILFTNLTLLTFTIAVCAIAFAFGGNLTVFPSIVADYFGTQNHNKNYGIIYQGFGIGGILGGLIANILGGFKPTFYLMLFVSLIAFLIMLFIKPPKDQFIPNKENIK